MQTTTNVTNWDTIVAGRYYGETKLVINNVEYSETLIMSLKTTRGVFDDEMFSIGNAYVGRIDATIRLQQNVTIPKAAEVKVYVRVSNSELTSGWLQKGVFYIYQREVNADNTLMTFVGFDTMFKGNAAYPSSTLEWSATSPKPRAVLDEISAALGVTLDARTAAAIPANTGYTMLFPAQYNMREVLQSIGVMYMGNFCMSDTGELLFVGIADIDEPTPEPEAATYTINFLPNGTGVIGLISQIKDRAPDSHFSTVYNLSQYFPDPPQRNGYTFVKFNTAADGSGTSYYIDESEGNVMVIVAPNEVVTLYAIWSAEATGYLIDENSNKLVFGSDRILI